MCPDANGKYGPDQRGCEGPVAGLNRFYFFLQLHRVLPSKDGLPKILARDLNAMAALVNEWVEEKFGEQNFGVIF